jgi:hypothetical protein
MKNLNEPLRRDDDRLLQREGVKPEGEVVPFESRDGGMGTSDNSLLAKRQIDELRARWTDIQTEFVDEPRRAVEDADKLVAAAINQIADGFSQERAKLEKQWNRGEEVSTEHLRMCLQHYRAFFSRLLSI